MGRLAKTKINYLAYICSLSTLLFIIISINGLATAQTKVRFVDFVQSNPFFSETKLLENITLKPNTIFNENKLIEDIENLKNIFVKDCLYFTEVFLDSLIFSNDSLFVDLVFHIQVGPKITIGKIEITGNTLLTTEEIIKNFDTRIGDCLNQSVLESDIENLITIYENKGYPFASVRVSDISIEKENDNDLLKVAIEINEDVRIKIDQIQVEGNKDTKSNVIVREIRIQNGEIYNQKKVDKIKSRLERLKIFSNVEEPELLILPDTNYTSSISNNFGKIGSNTDTANSGAILIKVTEGNTNRFDGIVGYVPGSGREEGYFTGLVDVGMRNLFGTGRKLNVRWSREDRFSQEIGIRYLEPWVFNYPINIGGYFFQRQQDTTYIKRIFELKSNFMLSENLIFSGLFNQEQIIPSADISTQIIRANGTASGGIEIQYDTRDDIFNPTSGAIYRTDYLYGRKKIYSLKQTHTVQRLGIDIEWFYPTFSSSFLTFRRQVAAISLHGREVKSSDLEITDMYRFGGAVTLRGYRENQFLGSRIVWSNLEYRFLTGRRSYFFGFFDLGYYFRPGKESDTLNEITESVEGSKYGYGIGMKIETAVGIVGISFALGKGDTFSQAKLHFNLINEF